MKSRSNRSIVLAALVAAWVPLSSRAAGLVTSDPSLPPVGGKYLTPDAVHATYSGPGLLVVLQKPEHVPFAVSHRGPSPTGTDEIEDFDSTLQGTGSVNGSPAVPINLAGPVQTVVFGKIGNVTGTFDTEMLSMSLTGSTPFGPIMIRESPTLPSTGQTKITDIGGGLYRIESFFDVFTELSVDGGETWLLSSGSTRVDLVPEPGAWGLAFLAATALPVLGRRMWRRRA
jgi:hypothetical protein